LDRGEFIHNAGDGFDVVAVRAILEYKIVLLVVFPAWLARLVDVRELDVVRPRINQQIVGANITVYDTKAKVEVVDDLNISC
jgi:hypothetical protein